MAVAVAGAVFGPTAMAGTAWFVLAILAAALAGGWLFAPEVGDPVIVRAPIGGFAVFAVVAGAVIVAAAMVIPDLGEAGFAWRESQTPMPGAVGIGLSAATAIAGFAFLGILILGLPMLCVTYALALAWAAILSWATERGW